MNRALPLKDFKCTDNSRYGWDICTCKYSFQCKISNLLKLHSRFFAHVCAKYAEVGIAFVRDSVPYVYCFAVSCHSCLEAPSDGWGVHHVLLLCGLEPSSSQHTMITYHPTPHSEIANHTPWCDPWIFLTNPHVSIMPQALSDIPTTLLLGLKS